MYLARGSLLVLGEEHRGRQAQHFLPSSTHGRDRAVSNQRR